MAGMMLFDQVKSNTGVFKGDIEVSIDNLITEMRTIYGEYIPVQIDSPFDYYDADELAELETKAAEILEEEEKGALGSEDAMEDEGIEDMVTDLSGGAIADRPVEEPESISEDLTKGPMGGPDVDEHDILLDTETDDDSSAHTEEEIVERDMTDQQLQFLQDMQEKVQPTSSIGEAVETNGVELTQESEMVKGGRKRRQERQTEEPEEEDAAFEKLLEIANVDLPKPDPVPQSITESEPEPEELIEEEMANESWEMGEEEQQNVGVYASQILTTYARDELLRMSDERFLQVVRPLNMDIGPFRAQFLDKLAYLARQSVQDREAEPETDLIELSLAQTEESTALEGDLEIDADGMHASQQSLSSAAEYASTQDEIDRDVDSSELPSEYKDESDIEDGRQTVEIVEPVSADVTQSDEPVKLAEDLELAEESMQRSDDAAVYSNGVETEQSDMRDSDSSQATETSDVPESKVAMRLEDSSTLLDEELSGKVELEEQADVVLDGTSTAAGVEQEVQESTAESSEPVVKDEELNETVTLLQIHTLSR